MRTSLYLLFCSFICLCTVNSYRADPMRCFGFNEYLDCIKDCAPEKTCQNRNTFRCTDESQQFCRVKCVCKNGFYKNKDGLCVREEQCLDCSGPNEYYACGGACDNVCADLQFRSQDKCDIINVRCNDKCYCKKGFARNDKGICIPINECPPNCPFPNEEYTDCKRKCPSDKCTSLVERCVPSKTCCPGCVCKSGFLRKADGEPCVPTCECPQRAGAPECNK